MQSTLLRGIRDEGSASVAADYVFFMTETDKHRYLKLFLLCHKTFISGRYNPSCFLHRASPQNLSA
ncbi:hypothetical protein EGM70_09390 [Enterobacteriaceae bacterium 89]|nr:hypothetical protein [Enterobacteriaceae bacterium 89]